MLDITNKMKVLDNNKELGSVTINKFGDYKFIKHSNTRLSSEQEYNITWAVNDLNSHFKMKAYK